MQLYFSIFRFFCSQNSTFRNFHHFIDISYLMIQKIVNKCFLSDIAVNFPCWSETPVLPCTQQFSHWCLLSATYLYR